MLFPIHILLVPAQVKSSLLLPLPTWLIPAHLLADLTSSNSGNTMSPFRQLTPTGLSNPAHLHICLLDSMLLDIDRVCLARLGPLCSVVLKCRPTLITLSLCWRVTVRIKQGGHKVHRRYSRTFAGYAQDGLMVEGEKPIKRERPQIGERKQSGQEKRSEQKQEHGACQRRLSRLGNENKETVEEVTEKH